MEKGVGGHGGGGFCSQNLTTEWKGIGKVELDQTKPSMGIFLYFITKHGSVIFFYYLLETMGCYCFVVEINLSLSL